MRGHAHLQDGAFGLLVNEVDGDYGDPDDGGERHHPAHHVGPHRVEVVISVLGAAIIEPREAKDELAGKNTKG